MKTTFSLCLALLAAVSTTQGQILRPEALRGAALGGVAGAVIGNNSGDLRHNAWKGAAIGAGVGLIAGEAIGNARATRHGHVASHRGNYGHRDHSPFHVGVSYGRDHWGRGYYGGHGFGRHGTFGDSFGTYGYGRHRGWGYTRYVPSFGYYPGYGYGYPHASYGYYGYGSGATNGLLLGALAGGVIGHNSGDLRHSAWRGAAWGAGLGWLLGSVADANRRAVVYDSAPVVMQPAPVVQVQPQPAAAPAQPQQITIINNYYNASPMSSANGLFGR